MTQAFRLKTEAAIRRDIAVQFQFDGKSYLGYSGDTLASALLANGVHLVGRSFKYHRPRGILSCGSEEPNALVELRTGAEREPNTRATTIELYDGLEANSQNRWPSLRFDLLSMNSLMGPLFVAGFYYKTFMWPASFWEPVYERLIRRAAGLGRASTAPDPDTYETCHLHCDVLVVGAGPAGLMAAHKAADEGARVVLCDENPWLGGRLAYERHEVDGLRGMHWVKQKEAALSEFPHLTILKRTTVFGAYDHNVFGAVERVSDHLPSPPQGQPRQRLWVIRAKLTVVATGAQEQPLVFPNNDLPGIMLASAVRAYANRFSVAAGRRVVVITNNDNAYYTALDLVWAGVSVQTIIDTRDKPGALAESARAAGIEICTGIVPRKAIGNLRVQAVELITKDGVQAGVVECDCVAMSGGFNPVAHLVGQRGPKPSWSNDATAFIPGNNVPGMLIAGAARGVFGLSDCLRDGEDAGRAAGRSEPLNVRIPLVGDGQDKAPQPIWLGPAKGKSFVDFQNDVTADDIRLASREGYLSPEHTKRYTTLAMATDQGKTSQLNGLAILANAQGKSISAMQTITNRPPYVPVAIGSLVGHRRARHFVPIRRTALQGCHERAGAAFMEAGNWLRPKYYQKPGETPDEAINREVLAVRAAAGLCDVSTLGKIELFGLDATEFLNRLYINSWTNLPANKARYGLMLREDGMVFDDGTVSRLDDEHFFITTTTANAANVMAHMEHYHQCLWPELDVVFCSVTEQWAGMALAGPNARTILEKVVDVDVSNTALPFMGVITANIGNAPARIFRISFSGELAYEINVPWGFGEAVWERFLQVGAEHGLHPYGLEALNILRIEKGHVAGPELDGRTTASDLGLGRMMSTKKEFIGRVLTQREALSATNRLALVGIKSRDGKSRLRAGAHIIVNSNGASAHSPQDSLGHVTSVCFSPVLNEWIGLALVSGGAARLGAHLCAGFPLKNEFVPVEIVQPCFIDPEGKRLHA